jgi:hypothetical protein
LKTKHLATLVILDAIKKDLFSNDTRLLEKSRSKCNFNDGDSGLAIYS